MLLFNPASYDPTFLDDASRAAMKDLVAFFEDKGLAEMKQEYYAGTWYKDFLDFNAEKGLFAGVATPANVASLMDEVRERLARLFQAPSRCGFSSFGVAFLSHVEFSPYSRLL